MNQQSEICKRFGSAFVAAAADHKVGLALGSLKLSPIYGVRTSPEDDTSGWYLWAGPYSDAPDFFQPVHVAHLGDLCPITLPYLGLAPGFKFIIDASGYEDVWFEGKSDELR